LFSYLSKLNKEIQANQGSKGGGSTNFPNQISPSLYRISIGIVIKPGPGVDSAKGPGPGFHGSTRVHSGPPRKIKKKLKF